MPKGISVVIPVYDSERRIRETLESVKDIADEIIVVHDGYCYDRTLEIAEEYGAKVYTNRRKGRSAFTFGFGLKKAKYDWILKLDDDESLSKQLQKNIRKLIESKNYDAFSFIHPLWDGEKMITKTYPRKTVLARRSKISYFGFPGWDMNITTLGKVYYTKYILQHKPIVNQDVGWEGFNEKVLGRYAPSQVQYMFSDPSIFQRYNYRLNGMPRRIEIRKKFPVFTNMIYGFLAFFKHLFLDGAVNEGKLGVQVCIKSLIYDIYLGYLIQQYKKEVGKK